MKILALEKEKMGMNWDGAADKQKKSMGKKIFTIALIFWYAAFLGQDSIRPGKILIVATNVDILGKNENGTFLIEIAYPFRHFVANGYDVDVVTPKGGSTAIYPKEFEAPGLDKIRKSELFISKTRHSISPDAVKPADYVAVYYPVGYGQFFDVMNDRKIAAITARIYEQGGVVGTAGHGAVSLSDIKLSNGRYLVEGKKLTCFPGATEVSNMGVSDFGKLLPFNMEDTLKNRGADLIVCGAETRPGTNCAMIIDHKNRIVTASYADKAQWVAEQMVLLLAGKDIRTKE